MNRKYRCALGAAFALIALGAGVSQTMARTNRALLVGVTQYDNRPQHEWLSGPANDAVLVRDYLTDNPVSPFAKENITLIASDIEGAEKPTRAAILKAFDDLAARAEPGDFVFIQLSGHGSQQPAANLATELDGKDEIFLPMDIAAKIDETTKKLANAIVDDEIGEKLDAIRNKGAFVWLVVDTCHSGTATRAFGANPGERSRNISPASLGITPGMFPKVEASRSLNLDADPDRENSLGVTDKDGQPDGGRGGLVAFFATQTAELAPELPLPDSDSKIFGLLTYTLLQQVAANPGVTYRQLGQGILQQYLALNRITPTPMFEGDLDAPVFGVKGDPPVMQWQIAVDNGIVKLPAGRLNRLEPGTKLAVLPGPQSPLEDAIGYIDVRSATNMSSQLLPAAFRERAALRLEDIPAGAYARVVQNAINFEMNVALPDPAKHPEAAAQVKAALDAISGDEKAQVKLKLVDPDQAADIRLIVESEADLDPAAPSDGPRLWFLPPSGEMTLKPTRRPPSLEITGTNVFSRNVGDYLVRMSRAINLSRLAGAEAGVRGVKVQFLIARNCVRDGDPSRQFIDKPPEPIEAGKVPILQPGDCILFQAENGSRDTVDLNVMHVGSNYDIGVVKGDMPTYVDGNFGWQMFPVRLNEKEKVPPTLMTYVLEDGKFGNERLIAVITEAGKMTDILNLSYMEQEATRGGVEADPVPAAQTGFESLLSGIAEAPKTRDFGSFKTGARPRGERGSMMVFPIETTEAAN